MVSPEEEQAQELTVSARRVVRAEYPVETDSDLDGLTRGRAEQGHVPSVKSYLVYPGLKVHPGPDGGGKGSHGGAIRSDVPLFKVPYLYPITYRMMRHESGEDGGGISGLKLFQSQGGH
jgi:hypothetical protein